jgi:hypothetical protein
MVQPPAASVTILEPSGKLLTEALPVPSSLVVPPFRPAVAVGSPADGVRMVPDGGLSPLFSVMTLQLGELENVAPPELAVCAAASDAPQPNAISDNTSTFMASSREFDERAYARPWRPGA